MSDLAFIDTSGYQHPGGAAIDWRAVKASGRSGVYVKLSEGLTLDPHGQQDARDAAAAGLHVGVYHFAQPNHNSAASEAAAFNAYRAGLPCDCPPCLDTETQPITQAWNDAWLAAVPGAIGYTFRSARGTLSLPDSRVWIAAPGGTRGDYLGIQYGTGTVPGVPAVVDLDWFDPSIVQGDTAMGGPFKPNTHQLHWHYRNQDQSVGHGWMTLGSPPASENLGGAEILSGWGAWTDDGLYYCAVATGVDNQVYVNTYDDNPQSPTYGKWGGWFPTGTYDYPAPGPIGPPGQPGPPAAPHTHPLSGSTGEAAEG